MTSFLTRRAAGRRADVIGILGHRAASSYDTCVGPGAAPAARLTLNVTRTSPVTVLMRLSTRPLTTPESLRNRVMSGDSEVLTANR